MSESEQIMRRYLLGELPEAEQSALEEKYFTDPDVFNQVLKAESELVDGYARDQLSKEVRERVEKYYMGHPARAERVNFAAALTTRLDQFEEPVTRSEQPIVLPVSWWQRLLMSLRGQNNRLQLSMALATLLVVLGGIWVYTERRKVQKEATQTQAAYEAQQQREREQSQRAADERKRTEELGAERERVATNSQQTPSPSPAPKSNTALHSVSLALTVGGVRGGSNSQIPTLVIQPATTQAQLLLNLKTNDFPSYRATLQTVAGLEIFSQTNLRPRRSTTGASFAFSIPTNKLESGDYVLTLRGVSPNGEVEDLTKSLFRVEKK